MGFLDNISGILGEDIFKTQAEGGGFQEIPLTEDQKKAAKFLENLLSKQVTFKPRQIAGLTDTEQQGIKSLRGLLGFEPGGAGFPKSEARETAIAETTRTATTPVGDVSKIPEIQNVIASITEEGNRIANRLSRSLQTTGTLTSSLGGKALGRQVQNIQKTLAVPLLEETRFRTGRKDVATQFLETLARGEETDVLNKFALLDRFGGKEREITQSQLDAIFEAMRQTQLFPFNTQAGIAANILGEQRFAFQEPILSPSIFSQVAGAAAAAS